MTADPRGLLGNLLAPALADAFLGAGGWSLASLREATVVVLGRQPEWVVEVAEQILAAYPAPPSDRPEELVRFISSSQSFRLNVPGGPGAGIVHTVERRVAATPTVWNRTRAPRLDSVARLADWLRLSTEELEWFADTRGINRRAKDRRLRHYRYLWLNGRLVEAPKPRLRALQRMVLRELLDLVPTHDAAHGFVPGRSPHTFAAPHAGQPMVIRLDVTSFFASVSAARVYGLMRAAGLEPVAYMLTALCTTRTPADVLATAPAHVPGRDYRLALLRAPHLPQGAPTSPALANLCTFRLDRRLAGLAESYGLRYTRYADDLAFSGQLHVDGALRFVERARAIAADEGFRINAAKTRVRGVGDRQLLAGLVVNKAPAVPREEYDTLRALLHNAVHTGLAEQNREGHADFAAHLAGRISWVGHHHPTRAAKLQALLTRALAG